METSYLAENPEFLSVLFLVVGLVLASGVRVGLSALLTALDERLARYSASDRGILSPQVVRFASTTAFWVVIVMAVGLALLSLDMNNLNLAIDTATSLLGRFVAALAIVGAGYFLGLVAGFLLERFGHLSGPAVWLAPTLRWGVLLVAVIMALSQLQIDTTLISSLIILGTGVLAGGLMLSFALGSKALVANLLGGWQLRRFRVGDRVRVSGVEGPIVEIRPDGFDLDTREGVVSIPAGVLSTEQVLRVVIEEADETNG